MIFGNNEAITHVHTYKLYGKFTCMIAAFNGLVIFNYSRNDSISQSDFLFNVLIESISLTWRHHLCRRNAELGRCAIGANDIWAGRDLNRASLFKGTRFLRSQLKDRSKQKVPRTFPIHRMMKKIALFSYLYKHVTLKNFSCIVRGHQVPLENFWTNMYDLWAVITSLWHGICISKETIGIQVRL